MFGKCLSLPLFINCQPNILKFSNKTVDPTIILWKVSFCLPQHEGKVAQVGILWLSLHHTTCNQSTSPLTTTLYILSYHSAKMFEKDRELLATGEMKYTGT